MPAQTTNDGLPPRDHDDRRRYRRNFEADQQLRFIVDDREVATINWSSGGCLVEALKHWKVGDTVAGTLESSDGVPMGAIISEIVRIDDQARAALRFTTVAPLL